MKTELNINLKNETNDEIEIKISPNYAEILTEEDRAFLKGNFDQNENFNHLSRKEKRGKKTKQKAREKGPCSLRE